MLYMVECDISDSHVEAEWNAYYTERKLDEVLAVPGFRTSQRFKALEPFPSPYLAIHTVDSLDVLTGNAYRSGGGGFFDPRFQPYIVNWHRNLFSGLERAPAIADDELLAIADEGREALDRTGVGFAWLTGTGLDRSVAYRGIARVTHAEGERLARDYEGVVRLYRPLIAQRLERAGKDSPLTAS
jgi:hypothetical protein